MANSHPARALSQSGGDPAVRRAISRRGFVEYLSRAAAFGAVGLAASDSLISALQAATSTGNAAVLGRSAFSLADATHASFTPLIGTTFRIATPTGETCDAVLTEVDVHSRAGDDRRPAHFREPFSLGFRATRGGGLTQSICDVRHEQLGRMDLFLISAKRSTGEHVYHAVFG